jgi:hypothetical protein
VIDNRARISALFTNFGKAAAVWVVDTLPVFDLRELGHPLTYVVPIHVELFTLQQGIEDTEVRLLC